MRVIRPARHVDDWRRRSLLLGLATLAVGIAAGILAVIGGLTTVSAVALAAGAAALGLGVGLAWLQRAVRGDPRRRAAADLERLLRDTFDDAYTLILAPRLPIRTAGLTAILVGPPGVRAVTVRDWDGNYRVRRRTWEFDAGGREGWIPCRTNPSFEVAELVAGVSRWSRGAGIQNLPVRGVVAFPSRRTKLVLEEPEDEIVTAENVPWWANSVGRVQRLDAAAASRIVAAFLDAADRGTVHDRVTQQSGRVP